MKTQKKHPYFYKRSADVFHAGSLSLFPIHDAGDDGELFSEIFIFFLVILSIADLLALARLSEDMPQGIDEAGVSAEDDILIGTCHIDGADADAVLDGTGSGKDTPLEDMLLRPGSGRKDEGRPGLCHFSPHLREIELITDSHPRLDAMDPRLHERIPRTKELGFEVSLEKMPLAVLSDALSIRCKKEACIPYDSTVTDRKCPRRERHTVRPCKVRESFDQRSTAGKDMLFEMMKIIADRPQLGEHEEVALFCRFFHHGKSTTDISLHVTGSRRHLDHCDTHGILLKNERGGREEALPYQKGCEAILHSLL